MKRFLVALALCWGWVADAATSSGLYSATTWARTNLLVKSASDTIALGDVTADELVVGDGTGIGGTKIDVRWFGAVADDATSDFTAFEDAAEYCQLYGRTLYVPGGEWNFSADADFIDVTGSLTVVGDGPASIIDHGGASSSKSIFRFSTGTNLVVSGIKFQDVRYVWYIASGHPQIENATFQNCWTSNAAYFVYGVQTLTGTQERVKQLKLRDIQYYGNTNVANAFVWFKGIPWDNLEIDGCWIEGGRFGMSIGHDDPPITLNPHDYDGNVTVRNTTITDIEYAYSNCQGLEVLGGNLLVENCLFRRGSKVDSTGAEQQAIYAFARNGVVRNSRFENWGNTTDKGLTIMAKGASLAVTPYDTNTVATAANHASGWGFTLENNLFIDSLSASTGCGRIEFDTDGVKAINNTFLNYGYTGSKLINWAPSSSGYTELGFFDAIGNRFLWCKPAQYIYVQPVTDNSSPATRINIERNEVLFDQSGAVNYMFDINYAARVMNIERNSAYSAKSNIMARLGGNTTGRHYQNVRFAYNYASNFLYGLQIFTGNPGGANVYSGFHFEGNYGDTTAGSLLYVMSTNTIVKGRFYDNFMTNASTYGFPRLGTASITFTDCTYRTNGLTYAYAANGASSWLLNPPFYGVTTTTPTEGLIAGGWFNSNGVHYSYNGSAFVLMNTAP